MRIFVNLTFVIIITLNVVNGGGFWLPENAGTKPLGMGLAFVGKADDVSAVYHNPAGITQLEGTHFYLSNNLLIYGTTYQREGFDKKDEVNSTEYIPYFGVVSDFGIDKFRLGFCTYHVWGSIFDYEDDGNQRYLTQGVDLSGLGMKLNGSYKFFDSLSLSFGLKAIRLEVELSQAIDASGYELREYDIDTTATGEAYGYGFDLAILYQMNEMFQVGLVYESEVSFSANDGELEVDYSDQLPFEDKTIGLETEICTPAVAKLGLMIRPVKELSITLQIDYVFWECWDELKLELDEPVVEGTDTEVVTKKDWHNQASYRIGFEYDFTKEFQLRCGFMYDETAIDDEYLDPNLPGNDKYSLSLGAGYKLDNFSFDIAYMKFFTPEREVTTSELDHSANGLYNTKFDFISLSIGYKF